MRPGITDQIILGLSALVLIGCLAVFAIETAAGPLEPQASPGPTMKTLGDVPGAWRTSLSTTGADPCQTERFQCVLSGEAVLDQETGLVWERGPYSGAYVTWADAAAACVNLVAGGRSGWRLPTLPEMRSLHAPGQSPALPINHPFTLLNVEEFDGLWTATVDVGDRTRAYYARIDQAVGATSSKASAANRYWCVRAPDPAAPR